MTLSVLEGHSPMASLFKCDIFYLQCVARSLCTCRASCQVILADSQNRQRDVLITILRTNPGAK